MSLFLQSNGDVIYSKVIPGAGKVFRMEAILEATVDELYDILYARVQEMPQWNPSIQHIEVRRLPFNKFIRSLVSIADFTIYLQPFDALLHLYK